MLLTGSTVRPPRHAAAIDYLHPDSADWMQARAIFYFFIEDTACHVINDLLVNPCLRQIAGEKGQPIFPAHWIGPKVGDISHSDFLCPTQLSVVFCLDETVNHLSSEILIHAIDDGSPVLF